MISTPKVEQKILKFDIPGVKQKMEIMYMILHGVIRDKTPTLRNLKPRPKTIKITKDTKRSRI